MNCVVLVYVFVSKIIHFIIILTEKGGILDLFKMCTLVMQIQCTNTANTVNIQGCYIHSKYLTYLLFAFKIVGSFKNAMYTDVFPSLQFNKRRESRVQQSNASVYRAYIKKHNVNEKLKQLTKNIVLFSAAFIFIHLILHTASKPD